MSQYPITQNLQFVSSEDIEAYISVLFDDYHFSPQDHIGLRGIGEKGTSQEGVFRDDVFLHPSFSADLSAAVLGHCSRWAQYNVASFIVPAVLRAADGGCESVKSFTALMVDLDNGIDTNAALEWLTEEIGEPSMVVRSGGTNDMGTPKRHVYWRFEDEVTDIEQYIQVRHALAAKVGGDLQFGVGKDGNPLGRAHQPIRIAGSCHSKGGKAALCSMERYTDTRHGWGHLWQRINSVEPAPWGSAVAAARAAREMTFSASSSAEVGAHGLLTQRVSSGSADGISRFDAFSKVAGHYLHCCRKGEMRREEAYDALCGWVAVQMDPPWPDERVRREWNALLTKEIMDRGPLPEVQQYESIFKPMATAAVQDAPLPSAYVDTPLAQAEPPKSALLAWAGHRWITEPAPEMKWLVEGLIAQGEQNMFASQGGSGKSMAMLDLGLRIASYDALGGTLDGQPMEWLGQRVLRGGTVVLILNEDSQTTLHIRTLKLSQHNLLQIAGDRFIPLPMPVLGGAFCLSDDEGKPTQKWMEMFGELKKIPDLALVVWDTFSTVLHGPEIDSSVINQMMREANRVTGELGAACLWLHHVRKSGAQDQPIKNKDEMYSAVRGSSAILGSMRQVIGMWKAPDWDRRCKGLGIKPHPDAVWRMGVVKTNLDQPLDGERTLIRSASMRLLDVTDRDPYANGNTPMRLAWLVLAVNEAARAGHPFSNGTKNDTNGLYMRRDQLPVEISKLGWQNLAILMRQAVDAKMLVAASAKGSTSAKWLDLPTGSYATNEMGEELVKGAWTAPDWSAWAYDEGQEKCVRAQTGVMALPDPTIPVDTRQRPTYTMQLPAATAARLPYKDD